MIRRMIKGVAKRVLGREAQAPVRSASPAQPAPEPPEQPEPEDEPNVEIDAEELSTWKLEGQELVYLDIREPNELRSGHVDGALLVPMNQVPHRLDEIPKDKPLVVYCAVGGRSFGVAHFLREHGYGEAWSLVGGFSAAVDAGAPSVIPPGSAKFPLTSRVQVTREPLEVDGVVVPSACNTGTVQAIREEDGGRVYTIGLKDEEGRPFVVRVAEDELSRT